MNDVEELSHQECLGLLRSSTVGRIALSTPLGPQVTPVGYVLVDDGIVVRTSPFSLLGGHAQGAMVAFEVDHAEGHGHQESVRPSWWSVIVRGRAHVLTRVDDLERLARMGDTPLWTAGARSVHLQVPLTEVTGRRVTRVPSTLVRSSADIHLEGGGRGDVGP